MACCYLLFGAAALAAGPSVENPKLPAAVTPSVPVIRSPNLVVAGLGTRFRLAISVDHAPQGFAATGLPAGLTLQDETGVIAGIALTAGDFEVSLVASNAMGVGSGSFLLRVSPVTAWGSAIEYSPNSFVPPIPHDWTNAISLYAGYDYRLASTDDGRILGWGNFRLGREGAAVIPPSIASPVVAMGGTRDSAVAVDADGQLVLWGIRSGGPLGTTSYIAPRVLRDVVSVAGEWALTTRGRVVRSNDDNSGRTSIPGLTNVIAIAASESLALALRADGQVLNFTSAGGSPAAVPAGTQGIVAIAAGWDHGLALLASGRVVAWGNNTQGQCDVPSAELTNAVALAAGFQFSLAVTADGRVVQWGTPTASVDWANSVKVPDGLANVLEVSAHDFFCLALTGLPQGIAPPEPAGPRTLMAGVGQPFHHRIRARHWAASYEVEGLPAGLALDSATGVLSGRPVQAGTRALTIRATNEKGSTSWTVSLIVLGAPAITFGGTDVAHWGAEFRYQVIADQVPDWFGAQGLPPGLGVDQQTGVISGIPEKFGDFPVTLLASNQHGIGSRSLTLRVPTVRGYGSIVDNPSDAPPGLPEVVAISVGMGELLALNGTGRILNWNPSPDLAWPAPPMGSGGFVAVEAGYHGESLAVTADGRVIAMGGPPVPESLTQVVSVAHAGESFWALTSDGRTLEWGWNQPLPRPGPTGIVAIAAGWAHVLALRSDGTVVDIDAQGAKPAPVGLSQVVAVACGWSSRLALTSEGRVVTWGPDLEPVPAGLSNVVAIAAGDRHAVALLGDGRVVEWGTLNSGRPFDPIRASSIASLRNVIAIAASGDSTAVLFSNPSVPVPRLAWKRGPSRFELTANGWPGMAGQILHADNLAGPWYPYSVVHCLGGSETIRLPEEVGPARFFRFLRR